MFRGGGALGVLASLGGSISKIKSDAAKREDAKGKSVTNITYNVYMWSLNDKRGWTHTNSFSLIKLPRVKLFLDFAELEVSDECRSTLEAIKASRNTEEEKKNFLEFQQRFGIILRPCCVEDGWFKSGHFFPTQVELGGRLHSAEDLSAIDTTDTATAAKAFKAAALASLSGSFAQASGNFTHETTSSTTEDKQTSYSQKSVVWEAVGGDTLLCNSWVELIDYT